METIAGLIRLVNPKNAGQRETEDKKDARPKRKIYLKKLNRLGRPMSELTNGDLPL